MVKNNYRSSKARCTPSSSSSAPSISMSSSSSLSKVEVKPSLIPNAGMGLFALQPFQRGDVLCHYSGALVDEAEAKYLDPTYTVCFELGRGFRLIGDYQDGDPGIYANATHPTNPSIRQNARFVLQSKQTYASNNSSSNDTSMVVLGSRRGRFEVRAMRDIAPSEEVIVSYGEGYWHRLARHMEGRGPIKSLEAVQRDQRACKRQRRML
ncbi:SET domain-containing protein-lysine N-methyltransferase [archaeon]|nr:MAG: SET domain-containing protein-lysine N-methyltransferase [archaeon]